MLEIPVRICLYSHFYRETTSTYFKAGLKERKKKVGAASLCLLSLRLHLLPPPVTTYRREVAGLLALHVRVVLEVAAVLEPVDGEGQVAVRDHARELRPRLLLQVRPEAELLDHRRFCGKRDVGARLGFRGGRGS